LLVASLGAAEHATKATSSGRQNPANLCAHDGSRSRDVYCVAPGVSVEGLAAALIERGLRALFVIDGSGRIVGVVPADG
jgi:CBS domain-containing protein